MASYNLPLALFSRQSTAMTHTIKAHLAELMRAALISVVPEHADANIILERPKQSSHGDFSCPLAMQLARS
ncbi:hypothetical protein, partial [Candidatus Propionivibrio aalborgensis]|uniref:hypothetical protein n=1 Tax=Candidatus Propionivibrio aalborgensis TaxID=1860101 RepID=UPI00316AEB14